MFCEPEDAAADARPVTWDTQMWLSQVEKVNQVALSFELTQAAARRGDRFMIDGPGISDASHRDEQLQPGPYSSIRSSSFPSCH